MDGDLVDALNMFNRKSYFSDHPEKARELVDAAGPFWKVCYTILDTLEFYPTRGSQEYIAAREALRELSYLESLCEKDDES